jgi:hypothetical protein
LCHGGNSFWLIEPVMPGLSTQMLRRPVDMESGRAEHGLKLSPDGSIPNGGEGLPGHRLQDGLVLEMPLEHGHQMLCGRGRPSNVGVAHSVDPEQPGPDQLGTVDSMPFEIDTADGGLRIELSGLDRGFNWRNSVIVEPNAIAGAWATLRGALEPALDRRILGRGPHDGAFRPGRRRVAAVLGRGVDGKQFWAMRAGGTDMPLLVLDLRDHEFLRVVAAVDDPYATARTMTSAVIPQPAPDPQKNGGSVAPSATIPPQNGGTTEKWSERRAERDNSATERDGTEPR